MKQETNRLMITVAMMVAIFLVAIDVTVVSTAMPVIARDLHGLSLYSWVFAIYTLTTSVTTPIYGKLADLYGRKVIFIIGVVLFVVGSMLSGIAQSMPQLVWFRAFQGIGAGAVMPITFTIIGDLYPGEQRARMQGVFSSVWGVAGLLGPLLGGLFVDHFTWRWIFYINVPVGAVSLILVSMFLHENLQKRTKHIDYYGALTFTVGVLSLLYALLNAGSKYAWGSPTILGLFAISAVSITVFLQIESRVPEPMLPLSLFKIRVIAISNIVSFLATSALIGVNVYLPMWIQSVLGHSATNSGLTLMPLSVAWPLGSTLAGRYMYRIGAKPTALIGTMLVAMGTAWMLAVHLGSPYWYFIGLMVLVGLGMGYTITPTTVLVQAAVGWEMRGAATASNTFVRTLGQTIGITIFGSLFNSLALASTTGPLLGSATASATKTLAHALHVIFIAIFLIAVASIVATLFLPSQDKIMAQQRQVVSS